MRCIAKGKGSSGTMLRAGPAIGDDFGFWTMAL
jgi:hypothetical protein